MALKALQQQAKVNLFDFSQTKKPEQQTVESSWYQKRYFSDEQSIVNDMLSKWYSEDIARQTIVNRRQDLLKNRKLEPEEKKMLINMADSWVDMPSAVEMLKKYRQDKSDKQFSEMPLYKQAWKSLFDLSARYWAWITWEIGWFMDFATWWRSETWKQAIEANKLAQESFTTPYVWTAWELAWRWMVDYALTKWAWKVTWLWTKFSTLSPTAQIITWWAWYWALQPIWEKWSEVTIWDIATWAWIWAWGWLVLWKVAIPAITKTVQKWMKYGTAFQKWWVEWLTKSVTRDIKAPMTSIQQGIWQIADTLWTNINRMTKWEINKFKTEIWVSPWKFLNDRWITQTWDELVDTLSKNLTQSRKEADKWLESIAWRFKWDTQEIATDIIDTTTWKYKTIKQDPIKTMLEDNLKNASSKGMSKDSLKMKDLLEKYQEWWLEMKEINEAKRWFNKNNKFSYFADDTTSRKGFVTELDNTIRNWQYNKAKELWFENLKEINKQTKAYYKLLEWVTKWNEWSKWNLPIWLSDWLAFNADPSVFLLKQVAWSWKVKTWTLKLLNKLSWRSKQLEVKPALITNKWKNVNNTNNSNSSTNMENVELKNVKKPQVLSTTEKQKAWVLLKPKSTTNAIPNTTTIKPKKTWREVLKTKVDKNFKLREEQILEEERNKFLNFIDRQKEWKKEFKSVWNIIKDNPKYQWLLKQAEEKKAKNEKAIMTIYGELEWSKAWERVFNWYWADKEVIWISSTFPKYIPEKSRTTPIITRIIKHLNDWDVPNPKNVNVYEWYQAVIKRFESLWWDTKIFLKKLLPSNFKEKAQDLVDKTMEKIGWKTNLMWNQGIWADKTALLKGSDDLKLLKQDEIKNIKTNPKAKNQYVSWDFKPLTDLDSDALFRAIWTYDFDNIPKQVTLYRWIKSNKDFDLFDWDFLTKNKKIAQDFAWKNWRVKAFKVNTKDLIWSDFWYEEVIYKQAQKSKPLKKSN